MQVGIDSFAAFHGDDDGTPASASVNLRKLIDRIVRADEVGLDVFGIGEHHRAQFLDSAPVVILAAAAARTSRIRLTSAVTVLSAADPVRVFQQFATLDLISQGRAEIVAGRGSFIESFPLFEAALPAIPRMAALPTEDDVTAALNSVSSFYFLEDAGALSKPATAKSAPPVAAGVSPSLLPDLQLTRKQFDVSAVRRRDRSHLVLL